MRGKCKFFTCLVAGAVITMISPQITMAEDDVVVIDDGTAGGAVDDDMIFQCSFEDDCTNAVNNEQGEQYGRRSFMEGIQGKAVYFSGENDFIVYGSEYDIPADYTVNMWVNVSGDWMRDWQGVVSKNDSVYFFGLKDSFPGAYIFSESEEGDFLADGISPEEWHMLTFVHETERTKFSIYIDGAFIVSYRWASPLPENDQPLIIGRGFIDRDDYSYKGLVDEVFISTRAYAENEIQELYDSYQ